MKLEYIQQVTSSAFSLADLLIILSADDGSSFYKKSQLNLMQTD
jgi:hypothetical protein